MIALIYSLKKNRSIRKITIMKRFLFLFRIYIMDFSEFRLLFFIYSNIRGLDIVERVYFFKYMD